MQSIKEKAEIASMRILPVLVLIVMSTRVLL